MRSCNLAADQNCECEFAFAFRGEVLMSQGAKPASQARSRATRDRLVAALDGLLREKDFEGITIADLAREAGLAVGTVYRRFENKDAFIPVVFELYRERLESYTAGDGRIEVEPADGLQVALHAIVRSAWGFMQREGHLLRTAHLYARLRPDLVGEEWQAYLDAALASARQLISLFSEEIHVANHDVAAQMLAYLLNTMLIERGLYPDEGAGALLTIDDNDFVSASADTLFGYLATPSR
jgi:AcrR family transcriptional regulator